MNKPALDTSSLFGQELPMGGLYCGVVLQQRLDLMEHLLEFGRQLILLSGEKGAGKTTLLRTVSDKAGDRWQCIFLTAGPQLSASALLERVAAELDIDAPGDDEIRLDDLDDDAPGAGGDLLGSIRQRITELDRSGMTVVLVVDDADQLLIETVGALLQLARTEEPLAEARVLMAAVPEHGALVAALQQGHGQHGMVHVVEIPLLDQEQIAPFLAQRFACVGEHLDDWLSPDEVAALGAESGGNPGALVTLVRQALLGREPHAPTGLRQSTATADPGEGIGALLDRLRATEGPLKWAPLLALPLAAAAWFLFRSPAEIAPEAPPVTAPARSEPAPAAAPTATAPAAPATATKTVQLEGDRQRIEIALPAQPQGGNPVAGAGTELPAPAALPPPAPAEPMSTAPEAAAEAVEEARPVAPAVPKLAAATTPPAPPKPVAKPPAASEKPAAVRPAAAPKPQAAPKPAPKPAVAQAPKPAAAPAPKTTSPQRSPTSGYALQLFGVSTRSAASNFIARHGLGASARIIDTQRNGKPWFIVTYGNYPSRTTAQNAAARLPPAVQREVDPWVRDVKTLNSLPR